MNYKDVLKDRGVFIVSFLLNSFKLVYIKIKLEKQGNNTNSKNKKLENIITIYFNFVLSRINISLIIKVISVT